MTERKYGETLGFRLPSRVSKEEVCSIFDKWCVENGFIDTYHKGNKPLRGEGFMELLKIAGVIKPEEVSVE